MKVALSAHQRGKTYVLLTHLEIFPHTPNILEPSKLKGNGAVALQKLPSL